MEGAHNVPPGGMMIFYIIPTGSKGEMAADVCGASSQPSKPEGTRWGSYSDRDEDSWGFSPLYYKEYSVVR